MIVLETTIVTIALPSIVADLHLSGTSLTWMLNAYTLTYGSFLLVAGRLGDLYGPRRVFLTGIGIFTLTSLACGLAHTQTALLVARTAQGLGGAAVGAVPLSIVTNLFSRPAERVRAMAIYGFVCASGGAVGEVLGGFLSKSLGWRWIFLVNLPIGISVCALCIVLLPRDRPSSGPRQLDIAGAVVIATASALAIYALTNGSKSGWMSAATWRLLGVSAVLLLLFLIIETRVPEPLIPLRMFRLRNFATTTVAALLWAAGACAWLVIAALYLQRVLGYDPFCVGLAFAPATAIGAAFSVGLSAKILVQFGIRGPLWIGLLLCATGQALFAVTPLVGTFVWDVLPAMLLLAVGGGMASPALQLAAMSAVGNKEAGLASGVLTTSFLAGGALGLAVLASVADMRTDELQRSGVNSIDALKGGYHLAFLIAALFTATAGAVGALLLRPVPMADTAQSISVSAD
jgi:EmrB/QacA subfamily drug resistance transporter